MIITESSKQLFNAHFNEGKKTKERGKFTRNGVRTSSEGFTVIFVIGAKQIFVFVVVMVMRAGLGAIYDVAILVVVFGAAACAAAGGGGVGGGVAGFGGRGGRGGGG